VLYLPEFPCEWALSRWSGRPHGLAIDPLGVECFVAPPTPRRGLFGRRRSEPAPSLYLHVLVHNELSSDRIRSWARTQVARLGVLATQPDAEGDTLNRLAEEESGRLVDREWTPAEIVIDGVPRAGSAFLAEPQRWAAYVDLGADRIALVGRDLTLEAARLRTATADEARRIRTDALRV